MPSSLCQRKDLQAGDDPCPRPSCYRAYGSDADNPMCEVPGFEDKRGKLRRPSPPSTPGHEFRRHHAQRRSVMDGALLLIAGRSRPQPQTSSISPQSRSCVSSTSSSSRTRSIVQENVARTSRPSASWSRNHRRTRSVVPISAQLKYNIDVVRVPVQEDSRSQARLRVAREHDRDSILRLNKPAPG